MNKQTTDKIEKYLQNVFDYYNRKYNLNATLIFCNKRSTYARNEWKQKKLISSAIYYSIDYILNKCYYDLLLRDRLTFKTKQACLVQVLLHEIRHVIEAKSGLLYYELHILNAKKLKHDDRPLEKRADYFANCELKNWGCKFILK